MDKKETEKPKSWGFKDPKLEAAKAARKNEEEGKKKKSGLLKAVGNFSGGMAKGMALSDEQTKRNADWLK